MGAPKIRFLTSPPLRLAVQAPPDGLQHIIWAFSRTPPESANASVDIKVHHAFGSTTLNLTRTAAAPSDDTGGNGDGDEANGSTPTPTDGASDASEPIMPGLAGFVHAGLCMAAFLLVIPSGALVVRYAELTGSPAAFEMHRILQFGVGAFASGPLYRGLPAHLFFFFGSRLTRGDRTLCLPAGVAIVVGVLAYLLMDTRGSDLSHKVILGWLTSTYSY